jgi:hypothetical protein
MNVRLTLLTLIAVALAALVSGSAIATKVPIKGNSPDRVQGKCSGVFWPQGGSSATYGCLNSDGSGIVCGGKTAKDKKTCDTFRAAPKGAHRNEIAVAVARARR